MRLCINGRQPFTVIKKADEIKFAYVDRERILDLVEDYSDKTIILDVPGKESEWPTWEMYNEKFDEFYIALHDLSRADEFNLMGIKWYWPYPITTYYEMEMIVDLHPSYLLIGPPLTFDLNNIRNHNVDSVSGDHIPLRMVVNVAHPAYLPDNGTHGICGQWVRPEDAELYATRIRCFEFDEVDGLKEEAILLDTYRKGEWPGNLNFLIKRLNYHIDNRGISEELGERRMYCGHRCWSNHNCRLCINEFKFTDMLRKVHYEREQKALVDNN